MIKNRKNQLGQVALIALLVLTIATTVGLSLIARGTTDVSVTRNIEESTRAFSAAEAGIEVALRTGVASAPTIDEQLGLSYSVTVVSVSATATQPLVLEQKTLPETTETIWLVSHSPEGALLDNEPEYTSDTINVCWSQESPVPAIVVSVLYRESSDKSYRVAKGAYDPDASRRETNNFTAPTAVTGGCGAGTSTKYKQTIRFTDLAATLSPAVDSLIALRVRPVYNGTQFVVTPVNILPVQGNRIESVGKTESGINRKIIVNKQFTSPATIFDAALYSQGAIE